MNIIIFQFCYHNHRNHLEMLDRIANTLDYYKEMNWIKQFTYNQDFFKKNKEVILVDIIPDFINPEIHSFDVNESEILEKITQITLDFVKTNLDPEKTLVIRLVHHIKVLTNEIE
jgi:hypothetical protein